MRLRTYGAILYAASWLPSRDAVVRVRAEQLKPLDSPEAMFGPHHVAYIAAAARVTDAMARNLLLAPVAADIIPLPHQIRALARAVAGDRVRYLLADEVGLGKTIEAGLIMRELKLRGLVRRTLVIAPKGLVTQWVAKMRNHFNEDFQLLIPGDFSAYRRFTRAENLWRAPDQVVCPLDAVKPITGRRGWSYMARTGRRGGLCPVFSMMTAGSSCPRPGSSGNGSWKANRK